MKMYNNIKKFLVASYNTLMGYKVETTTKNIREIVRIVDDGKYVYVVNFINRTTVTIKNRKGKIVNEYNVDNCQQDCLKFPEQKYAENYAKAVVKPAIMFEYEYNIQLFPIGYDSINNYGKFIWEGGQHIYSIDCEKIDYHISTDFCFDFFGKYSKKYGFQHVLNFYELLDGTDLIKKVISECKIDGDDEIVNSFDVVTLKTIPFDKLKASSKELEEMNKILKEFREAQEKYTNLLEKITNAK